MPLTCPRCDRPVVEGFLNGRKIILDAEPSKAVGSHPNWATPQILLLGEVAVILTGRELGEARRLNLPMRTRHGVTCKHPWKDIEE